MTEWEKQEAKKLLEDILSIHTVNSQDDEGALARWLAGWFKQSGIAAEIAPIDATRSNMIAVLPGQTEETVLLCGHMDTVPVGSLDEWHTDPFAPIEKAGRLIARGASDMKSGLAAMAYAFARLARAGVQPKSRLVLVGTADEEKTGLGAQAFSGGFDMSDAKALLIAEPTDCGIGIAQKGCLWIRVKARGKTAHAAYHYEGVSAFSGALAVAQRAQALLKDCSDALLGDASCVITRMQAGVANNMVPDLCEMVLDMRTTPGITHAQLLLQLTEECRALEAQTPGLQFELTVLNDRMPIRVTQDNSVLQQFKGIAAQMLGDEPRYTGISFFTDASIMVKGCPQVPVLLFGPGEQRLAHQSNESVALEQYYKAIAVYTEVCRQL